VVAARPKISVIVPVFNVEEYIDKCFLSLKSQTFSQFEVICINDGSTDGSLKMLEKYAADDNRFVVFSQKNQGQGAARNNALNAAKGDYIVFLDPDDWLEQNALDAIYNAFKKANPDVVQFDYFTIADDKVRLSDFGRIIKKKYKYDLKTNPLYNYKSIGDGVFRDMPLVVWNKAYSREFIMKNDIKFAPYKHAEDHIFTLKSVFLAREIYYINKPLYNYFMRLGSSLNHVTNENFDAMKNIEIVKNFLVENDLYPSYEKDFEDYKLHTYYSFCTCIPKENIQKFLETCKDSLSAKTYKKLKNRIKYGKRTFAEKIFSIKNNKANGQKYKILTIFGFAFEFGKK